MTANYEQDLRETWNLYHEKDIKEYSFGWQSWSYSQEQSGDKKQ